jgi:hypothetical protein
MSVEVNVEVTHIDQAKYIPLCHTVKALDDGTLSRLKFCEVRLHKALYTLEPFADILMQLGDYDR